MCIVLYGQRRHAWRPAATTYNLRIRLDVPSMIVGRGPLGPEQQRISTHTAANQRKDTRWGGGPAMNVPRENMPARATARYMHRARHLARGFAWGEQKGVASGRFAAFNAMPRAAASLLIRLAMWHRRSADREGSVLLVRSCAHDDWHKGKHIVIHA